MHIAQLFYDLFFCEHVEIIGTGVPEWRRCFLFNNKHVGSSPVKAQPCNTLLQNLHCYRKISIIRFPDKNMKVLRHNDVSNHGKFVSLPDLLEDFQEDVSSMG